jgi:esterase/lipase superfamily enzyme
MFIDALPALKERIDKVSVIVSDRDRTLLVSQTVNLAPRLGQFDGVDIEGVDLVDVTDIEGSHFTGHIYHLRNEQVAALIRGMLFGEPGS